MSVGVVAGCSGPVEPTQAPVVAVVAAPEPAPEIQAPEPEPPVPEDRPVPANVLVLHAAAVANHGFDDAYPLAGGGVAVVSLFDLVGAAGGQATLTRDAGYYAFTDEHFVEATAIGGRWPDDVAVTVHYGTLRATVKHAVISRAGEAWRERPMRSARGRLDYFSAYAGTPDGQGFALRVGQPQRGFHDLRMGYDAEDDEEPDFPPPSPTSQRDDNDQYLYWLGTPTVERLFGEGPRPPPLPAKSVALALQVAPAGDLYVQLRGGEVLHAAPGARRWRALPRAFAWAKHDSMDMFVGLDGRLVVSRCTENGEQLYRLDGAAWTTLPLLERCSRTMVGREDGTLWALGLGDDFTTLHRLGADGAWLEMEAQVPGYSQFTIDALAAVPGALWLAGEFGVARPDGTYEGLVATTAPGGTLLDLRTK